MFGKNKKSVFNEFGDKDYKMKEHYEADKLVVARFQRISSEYTEYGPMVKTTNQKYIFELVQEENKTRYREIFTGFITDNVDDTSKDKFNLPYVFEPEKFTEYFPQTEGLILPKLSFLWVLNDINYPKENEIVITKKNKSANT